MVFRPEPFSQALSFWVYLKPFLPQKLSLFLYIFKIELAQKLLQTENKHILKTIDLLLNQEDEIVELTAAQKKDLDKRLADHKAGKLKYYTLDEVRKSVFKAIKK